MCVCVSVSVSVSVVAPVSTTDSPCTAHSLEADEDEPLYMLDLLLLRWHRLGAQPSPGLPTVVDAASLRSLPPEAGHALKVESRFRHTAVVRYNARPPPGVLSAAEVRDYVVFALGSLESLIRCLRRDSRDIQHHQHASLPPLMTEALVFGGLSSRTRVGLNDCLLLTAEYDGDFDGGAASPHKVRASRVSLGCAIDHASWLLTCWMAHVDFLNQSRREQRPTRARPRASCGPAPTCR